jgi:predicted PurR-regulated permease PerM
MRRDAENITSQVRPQPVEPERSPFWWFRWVPTIVFVSVALYLLYAASRVALIPVLASLALAYLLNPLVHQVERRGVSRPVAAIVALAAVTLVAAAFLTFVIPDLWEQGASAGQKVLRYFTPESAARQRAVLRRYSPLLDRVAGERLETFLSDPVQAVGSPAAWVAGGLTGFLSTAAASLDLLLVPFFVFYILVDFQKWRESFEDLIPPRFRETFSRLFDEVGRILESYVRGQLLIALVMAALYAAGFALVGVPAWAGIAALAGFLNAIPYVGTALGLVLATGFTLADGGGLWQLAGVVAVFVVVQSVEGYYLTPRILGSRLSLHPMAVFLGLLIGGKLFGLLGIILAVPTIAIAKVFLKFARELYKGSHFYHAGRISPHEAPSDVLEERLAEAADTVLAEQASAESGDELLAVDRRDDDPVAEEVKRVRQ